MGSNRGIEYWMDIFHIDLLFKLNWLFEKTFSTDTRTWLNRWKFRGREISRRREMKKITCCQMQKSWWKIWGKIPNYPRNFYWNSIIPIEISLNYFAGYFLKGKILPRNFYKVTWYNNSDWNFAEIFCSRWQHFGEHFTTKFVSEILIKCAFYFGRNFAEIFCHCSNLAQ